MFRKLPFIINLKFININSHQKWWMEKYNKLFLDPGCPKKHGNSVTNLISSLLWISIVIPNFKTHNIIMSARIYFMKRVKNCKIVSIMSPQDKQWRRTSLLGLYSSNFLFYHMYSTTVCSQNINTQNVNIADETLTLTAFSVGITILNQRII